MEVVVLAYKDRGGHRTILGIYSSEKKAVNVVKKYFKGTFIINGTGFEFTPMKLDITDKSALDVVINKNFQKGE